MTQVCVHQLAVSDTQDLQWLTFGVIHHSWVSQWKTSVHLLIYSLLVCFFFPFCASYGNWGFHRRSRGNNISQSISKCSFPSQLFTNRSRPPLWEQVTHCRGMHNLPMNCCIFCLVFTFFQRGGRKKDFFFPDKDIFCFWWMKSVCISLETTNKFTLGTGMKPSIHFMWVPSDGKSPSYCPTVLVFKSLKNEVTCNTPGSLGNTLMYRDILTLSNYDFPFVWVAIIFMCLCSWEKKKEDWAVQDLHLAHSGQLTCKNFRHIELKATHTPQQQLWWLSFGYKPIEEIGPNGISLKWLRFEPFFRAQATWFLIKCELTC